MRIDSQPVSSEDRTVRVWETVTRQVLHTLEGHTGAVKGCAFSPDGCFIASAGDRTVRVWDTATGHLLRILEGHTTWINSCAFSPDGNLIASTSEDKPLRIWNPDNGETIVDISLTGSLYSIGMHPFLAKMICGDEGGAVYPLELKGLEYGPIIVTAIDREQRIEATCPSCRYGIPIITAQFSSELSCPTEDCGLRLKINPFVVKMA